MANDYVDQVAGSIIRQLKEGTAPWQKPWQPGDRFMPYNPTTGNEYRGMNALWLMAQAETRGYGDARWMTFRQAQGQDAHVRKGETATPIQFWKWQGLEPVRDADGKQVLDQDGQPVRQMVRYEWPRVWSAAVFNAGQIEGLPPASVRAVPPEWERHERAETILANAGVPIRHVPGDRAFYRVAEDTITLPERSQFPSADRYYATALHELGHATGHPSRLARDLAHPFGSEGYAREELRAEIGSLMLGEQLGIGHDPGQHVAYVASWIKVLEHDPREVFRAAADAEKITGLIRSFERVQERTADQVQPPAPAITRQADQEQTMPSPAGLTSAGLDQDSTRTHHEQFRGAPAEPFRVPTMIREDSPAMQPPSLERTYLAVPYGEKDDAKQLGAKWDRAEKAWYVPAGVDLDAFTPWLPAKGSVHIAVDTNPVEQFAEAIRACGLQLDGPPLMDGRLHRVPVEGDKARERAGAYTGHLDGRPAGFIQNYRTGVKETWKASGQAAALNAQDRAQLAAEAAQKRHDRAKEREQQAERTAQQVDALWTAATPAEAHPYLTHKGVQPHGLRQDEAGRLLVPVQDADGRIWSVQRIGNDGFKQFEEGGRVEGGHFVIGDVQQAGPLLIAEGFATAATLHEMTGLPAIVAFNSGNLPSVAQTYRALYPDRSIYIAGDDDRHRAAERDAQGRPKVNVGRVKAEEAAAAIGSQAVFPVFPVDSRGTDWNDLAQALGRPSAAGQLRQALAIADREQAARDLAAARDETVPDQDHSLARSGGHALGRIGQGLRQDRDRVPAQELGQER
jgi:putative DNA primase/helicase